MRALNPIKVAPDNNIPLSVSVILIFYLYFRWRKVSETALLPACGRRAKTLLPDWNKMVRMPWFCFPMPHSKRGLGIHVHPPNLLVLVWCLKKKLTDFPDLYAECRNKLICAVWVCLYSLFIEIDDSSRDFHLDPYNKTTQGLLLVWAFLEYQRKTVFAYIPCREYQGISLFLSASHRWTFPILFMSKIFNCDNSRQNDMLQAVLSYLPCHSFIFLWHQMNCMETLKTLKLEKFMRPRKKQTNLKRKESPATKTRRKKVTQRWWYSVLDVSTFAIDRYRDSFILTHHRQCSVYNCSG